MQLSRSCIGSMTPDQEATMANALSDKERALIDAHWRAANYLSIGQIYLYDNPRRQPTSVFRRDVHLCRFDTAVGFRDPLGHVAAAQVIDQRFDCFLCIFNGLWRFLLGVGPGDRERSVRHDQRRCGYYSHQDENGRCDANRRSACEGFRKFRPERSQFARRYRTAATMLSHDLAKCA